MTIQSDLKAVQKELQKLTKQTEKIAAQIEKLEKQKTKATKPKAEVRPALKKAPAKKSKRTDTDRVLAIINRSKKGVNTIAIMKKTGFEKKKVWNIIHRTYKAGKIKRVDKGLYVGV
jgi:septal ring factor EnvC (AmiA/AmiB activator)